MGPGRCGTICLLDLGATAVMRTGIRWIQLGFDWDFNAVCFVGKASLEATRDRARWDTVRCKQHPVYFIPLPPLSTNPPAVLPFSVVPVVPARSYSEAC